jgi:hypothetical protein
MTRFVPVTVLMVVLAASRVASAQAGSGSGSSTLPDGSTISFDKLYLHEDGNPNFAEPKTQPDSLWNYFNLAHCQCGKESGKTIPTFVEATYGYLMTLQNAPALPSNKPLQLWVGSACDDNTNRLKTCCQLGSQTVTTIASIQATNGTTKTIPIYDAMNPANPEMAIDCSARMTRPDCSQSAGATTTATVWAIADGDGDGTPDFFDPKQNNIDLLPPPLPTNFRAAGGEGAIEISWTPPIDTSDTYAYQALCARADTNGPAIATGRPPRRYQTGSTLCGLSQSIDLGMGTAVPGAATAPDAGALLTAADLPPALADLDPTFLCGEEFSATATSLRISGLSNGVAYKVVLLAIDKFQNASGTFFTSTLTPVPSTDFWEDLHNRGSNAQGGLCLLAETYGDDSGLTQVLRAFRDDTLGGSRAGRWLTEAYYATLAKLGAYIHGSLALRIVAAVVLAPVVAFALLWHWLTLPGVLGLIAAAWWCGRRRGVLVRLIGRSLRMRAVRFFAAFAAFAAFAFGTGHAYAGGGYQPYWENGDAVSENQAATEEAGSVTWHVGIRLGPYVPDIDKQFGMAPGPYNQMFGGTGVMPMLDVDRILWSGFGQLGVGGSVGYMQKSAGAFADSSSPSDVDRLRSSADTNKFRLIPMALTATYRLTWFDDQYGVPVIPYVRGGLSYYLWWISTTDGSLAQVCKGTGMEPACSQNKALGASLGVQGSIGLAIRAERIDASAAVSMRASGIEHAGIYGELSLAQVNGFGSDSKLSVGDRTWFAGVDFEF